MAKKVPDYFSLAEGGKTPKNIENPSQYKDFPLAWQLSFIDDNSRWGIELFRRHFVIEDDIGIYNELPEDIHNDLYNAIGQIHSRRFDTLNSLLSEINRRANSNITAEQQRIILNFLKENPFWSEFYSKIRHFETNLWQIIEREGYGKKGKTKHHYISVSDIIPEAQKRLEQLKLDDVEELYSIRLSGEIRIFGIRKFNYFQVLWFDLKHEICPSSRN